MSSFQSDHIRPTLVFWLGAGFVIWAAATFTLGLIGDVFLENGWAIYAAFVLVVCAAFVGLFVLLARWRNLHGADRLPAAVAFSLAGMIGEVPVMMTFPQIVPALIEDTAGRFAAFLFAGYAALLAYAIGYTQWRRGR